MSSALEIFDIFQTISISALLVITIPSACFVYTKLMVVRPFSENYTFKLIVLNGATELLSSVMYLLLYQLTSFPFMAEFYYMLETSRSVTPLTIIYSILTAVSLHTSLAVALNRLKTIMFIRERTNDCYFFIISLALSILFAIPPVVDYSIFTTLNYVPITYDGTTILIPGNKISNDILRTVTDIIRIVVSLATLVVNIVLCVLITRERAFIDISDRKKFNGEKGLVITSIVSYSFYMIYFVDMILARYFGIVICGFAQWLFLGICSVTPFWCLMLFTPSVRRMAIKRRNESTVFSLQRQTVSGLHSPLSPSPSTLTTMAKFRPTKANSKKKWGIMKGNGNSGRPAGNCFKNVVKKQADGSTGILEDAFGKMKIKEKRSFLTILRGKCDFDRLQGFRAKSRPIFFLETIELDSDSAEPASHFAETFENSPQMDDLDKDPASRTNEEEQMRLEQSAPREALEQELKYQRC